MFDTIHTGDRCGQVKCMGKLLTDYRVGDRVELIPAPLTGEELHRYVHGTPRRDERTTFQVAMHSGGWVVVRDGVIADWVDESVDGVDRVDSLGREWDPERHDYFATNLADTCVVCAAMRGEPDGPDGASPFGLDAAP